MDGTSRGDNQHEMPEIDSIYNLIYQQRSNKENLEKNINKALTIIPT